MSVEAQKILREQMAAIPVTPETAKGFYSFLFTIAPHIRQFHKGAENITPQEVLKSERFEKQGTRLLTSVHVSIELMHNDDILKEYVYDQVYKHKRFEIPFEVFLAFYGAFQRFVEHQTKTKVSEEQKAAWETLEKQWLHHYKVKSDELGMK